MTTPNTLRAPEAYVPDLSGTAYFRFLADLGVDASAFTETSPEYSDVHRLAQQHYNDALSELSPEMAALADELLDRSRTGQYVPASEETLANVMCVVVPTFGFELDRQGHRQPGPANQYLAERARQSYPDLPKILQGEVADAYRLPAGELGEVIHRIDRQPGKELNTAELARQVARIMIEEGLQGGAALVAQPHHVTRAVAIFGANDVSVAPVPGLEEIWVPGSEEPWTRSLGLWRINQCLALAEAAQDGSLSHLLVPGQLTT